MKKLIFAIVLLLPVCVVGSEFDELAIEFDGMLEELQTLTSDLEAWMVKLRQLNDVEPPTEPPTEPPYPPALKVVNVTPQNWQETLANASRAEPGTHFVFADGDYDIRTRFNFGGRFEGTPENPIVLREAEGATATIKPLAWNLSDQDPMLVFMGSYMVIDGLGCDTEHLSPAGRQWHVQSTINVPSHHITFRNLHMVGSWRHCIVHAGDNITFEDCLFENCVRINAQGDQSSWPAVLVAWQIGGGSTSRLSTNTVYRNCRIIRSGGEGFHPSFCHGVLIEDCYAQDCRFANYYFNNSSGVICRRNVAKSIDPVPGRGGGQLGHNPPRAFEAAIEDQFHVNVEHGSSPFLFEDNLVDGGSHRGLLSGFRWVRQNNKKPTAWYSDWTFRRNIVLNVKTTPYAMEKVTEDANQQPRNCFSDVIFAPANPEAWTFTN
jgi:hypothetical protein